MRVVPHKEAKRGVIIPAPQVKSGGRSNQVNKQEVRFKNHKPQNLTGIKKYICDKFGDDCYLALLVVHAENGTLACDRMGTMNKNKTVDRGLWQLNSAYHKFEPDCFKNTDKAYSIYLSRGKKFTAWSAYNNGAYKRFIGKI